MRSFALAALAVALTTVAAHANTVATYDYGSSIGASSFNTPIDSLTVSLGIGPASGGANGPSAIQLFNASFANTATGNFAFTIDNTAPNWNSIFALLNSGANNAISPVATGSPAAGTELSTVTEFNDGSHPFIFSSPSQVATITSIELDLTNLQFTELDLGQGNVIYDASFNASVTFSAQPTTVATPLPAALPAGALLLTALAAATTLRKRRPA